MCAFLVDNEIVEFSLAKNASKEEVGEIRNALVMLYSIFDWTPLF